MARRTRTPRVVSSSTTTMRAHMPQKQHDDGSPGTAQGSSSATRFRASTGVAAPPRPQAWQSRFGSSMRATSSQQPTFNLLTGETSVPSAPDTQLPRRSLSGGRGGHYPTSQRVASRESSKENMAPPDAQEYETQRRRIEELKAEVGALNYRVSAYDQEKEMLRLQHDSELRDARRRAEEDFKLKQAAEAERDTARRSAEALQEELDSLRSDGDGKVRALEKRAREAEEEASLLREQLQDLSSARDGEARMAERKTMELRKQAENAQRMATEQAEEIEEREAALAKARTQLAERDATIGQLEADVLRLKAQTGDAETMAVIRRELTDQVQHIRALEATNRDQLTELKRLRQARKAVEVVEEEKRSLQRRLELSADLETELEEERIQRQRLEDERTAWTAYLQNEAVSSGGETELDSPEAVARALVQERLNSASLLEKLGSLEPELGQREEAIRQLEVEKAELSAELEKVKSMPRAEPAGPADKGRLRLERQRALAVKEVDYLRAQLKTFDAEDVAFQPENFDQAKAERVQQLEDLVDKYKAEVQSLHQEMSSLESSATSPAVAAAAGTKRPRESDENHVSSAVQSEQLGQLARKNRKLQEELAALQKSHRLADKELRVAKAQVSTAKESSRVRVLSLRSNPTSDHEAVKASRLRALERENAELLEHVARKGAASSFRTVPLSALDAARREVEDAKAEAASAHKTSKRLKEVWAAKSGEFKEAIFSTLGWTVTFIPNGKMRVESVYHPSESDEHENSIVFDGERGTMKVGGGPRSAFAQRIDDQIRFWVREKGCIPGFLAALTLEFYEEHSKSSRPG